MAATELLSVDDDAETSEAVTVSAGTPVAVGLKTSDDATPIPGGSEVQILLADDDSQLWPVGKLNASKPVAVLAVPGIYYLKRLPRVGVNVGAFRAA